MYIVPYFYTKINYMLGILKFGTYTLLQKDFSINKYYFNLSNKMKDILFFIMCTYPKFYIY
jgi:hypothetical protein